MPVAREQSLYTLNDDAPTRIVLACPARRPHRLGRSRGPGCAGLLYAVAEPDQKKHDTYFAGSVIEFSPTHVTVARAVLGKNSQKRTFRKITPATRVVGSPKARVRVTVSYTTDDSGDTATLIMVRTATAQKKN